MNEESFVCCPLRQVTKRLIAIVKFCFGSWMIGNRKRENYMNIEIKLRREPITYN